jgi:hypothetical protein
MDRLPQDVHNLPFCYAYAFRLHDWSTGRNGVFLLAESNVEQGSSVAVCSGVANWNCKYCVSVISSSSDIFRFSVRKHHDYIVFLRCNFKVSHCSKLCNSHHTKVLHTEFVVMLITFIVTQRRSHSSIDCLIGGTKRKAKCRWSVRDFRLPPLCKWDLRSSWMLRSVEWLYVSDVSEKPIGTMFKSRVLDCLNPDFVKIRWSRCRSIRTDGHKPYVSG